MQPSPALTMITGETGAGKSIMLGAVGLLLGKRADTSVLLDKDRKCYIEGEFDISKYRLERWFKTEELDYEEPCIIRREISPAGKSRAFINDTPVTLNILQDLGIQLMDIHSQHDTLQLGSHKFQRQLVDSFAGNNTNLEKYRNAYENFVDTRNQFESLKEESAELEKEADYNHFLWEELQKANLSADEQERLEEEQQIGENAEEIKSKLKEMLEILSNNELSVEQGLSQVTSTATQLSRLSDKFKDYNQRLESLSIELNDIIREIENEQDHIDFDAEQAQETEDRLSLIYQLQQKHKVNSVEDLLNIQKTLEAKVTKHGNLDLELESLEKALAKAREELNKNAEQLRKTRKKVIPELTQRLSELLKELGMPQSKLNIELEPTEPGPNGADTINILFSANKGIPPEEVSRVASGGEFTRLMFAVKSIMAEKTALPTVVFDEIDTGVSGEIARKFGILMKEMAERHQVIAISHLPQIAAKGDLHYFVYKDSAEATTVSKIRSLSNDERIREIAKMIGGENPTQTAMENARELMSS